MIGSQARKVLPGWYLFNLLAFFLNVAAIPFNINASRLAQTPVPTPRITGVPSMTATNVPPCRGNRHKPCFEELNQFYPRGFSSAEVYKQIGGRVYLNHQMNPDKFYLWCALGVSLVLNRAGYDILRDDHDQVGNPNALGSGADGKWYFYQFAEIVPYLKQELGEPLVFDPHKMETIAGKRGIIAFSGCGSSAYTGHITLWDGKQCADFCMGCDKGMLWVLH
jgi:hypothetical protein